MSNHAIPPPAHSEPTGSQPIYGTGLVPFSTADTHPDAYPETAPKNGRVKLIALIVSVMAITAAAVVWAASEHDAIKDWTAERDYATKNEVVDIVEKHYVSTKDFVEVKVEQKHIKEKVDDIDEKVDEMHTLLIKGERVYENECNECGD